jgi:chitin disaccharide deacetylase
MTAPPRTLIVNADDYGLTPAVSEGILRAHRDGVLTSTSVLVLAPGFAPTAGWLRDTEGIGVGAHLAVVGEDPPLLGAREIPTLVDARGYLPISWRRLLPLVAARRIDLADIEREWSAQLDAARDAGLVIDHLDSHQHVHVFPGLCDVALRLAVRHGIGAVRVTRSAAGGPVGIAMRRMAARLAARATAAGVAYPGDAAGLDEAGALDVARAREALARLAAGTSAVVELSGHPGAAEDPDRHRYAWDYRWADELAALCDPTVRAAIARHGFRLGTYRDLVAPAAVQMGGSGA